MAKTILRNLDQLMRHLEQSDAFTRLLDKVAKAFGFRPQAQIKEKLVEKIVLKEVTPQWAEPLETYQQMLFTVKQHPHLSKVLLPKGQTDDDLMTMLANLAQWDKVERIWDELAAQALQGRDIRTEEHRLLETALRLYNSTLSGAEATLRGVEKNSKYNYEVHQRLTDTGETVQQQILPGLVNAGGKLRKKILVRTV